MDICIPACPFGASVSSKLKASLMMATAGRWVSENDTVVLEVIYCFDARSGEASLEMPSPFCAWFVTVCGRRACEFTYPKSTRNCPS